MKKIKAIAICAAAWFLCCQNASAQSSNVKKAAQSVFTLTTFNADGTIHSSTHGAFTGETGEAVAMWHPFVGAARAVIIDTKGKQYDVDAMLGVSENYDICKFRIKDFNNSSFALPLVTTDAAPSAAYVAGYAVKNPEIKKIIPVRSEKFMTTYNYIILPDNDISETMLGCPVINDNGQLLGVVQRPEAGGQAFCADARITTTFKLTGFSVNDPTFRATGIRTALPAEEREAALALVLAASVADSATYEKYIDDFIDAFPSATDGYNARATRLVAAGRLQEADNMLQTEVKKADKKDEAYGNYAALVYQASIYKVDSTFGKWNLDYALELAENADKASPQPTYKLQQAQIFFAKHDYQKSLDLLTALQQSEIANKGEVFYEAAQCKAMLNAPKTEIMELLDKAVNAQKGAAAAPYILARGRQYDSDGEYRKAFRDYVLYDSIMQNRVNSADFYYVKFRCEKQLHQYQPALNDIAHAIVLNRNEPVYYAELANLQMRVRLLDDAVRTCDLGLSIADSYADLYLIKGIALCEQNRKQDGIDALAKAKELGDGRAEALIEKYSK